MIEHISESGNRHLIFPNQNFELMLAVPGTDDKEDPTHLNTFGLFPIIAWDIDLGTTGFDDVISCNPLARLKAISYCGIPVMHVALYNQATDKWVIQGAGTGFGAISLIDSFIELYEEDCSPNPVDGIFCLFD